MPEADDVRRTITPEAFEVARSSSDAPWRRGVALLLAWWRGRTPGKWLFRLRVLWLDNRPLTLWGCFEHFAGYAVGLATGLLGFLQIFWDPNRQAVHDKIVGPSSSLRQARPGGRAGEHGGSPLRRSLRRLT